MSIYSWTICEPDNPDVIQKGQISHEKILHTFLAYPWMEKLIYCNSLGEKAYFSPSVEFINAQTNESVSFSIAGDEEDFEYYIFYKRDNGKLSDITGQSTEDAAAFLNAFVRNENEWIESYIREAN